MSTPSQPPASHETPRFEPAASAFPSSGSYAPGSYSPPSNPEAGKGLRKWGKILSILGAIILALSVIGGIILSVVGFGKVISDVDEATYFSGTSSVTVESGNIIQLYALEGQSVPTCEVVGADGLSPTVGTGQSSTVGWNGQNWVSFQSFASSSTQEYTISCTPSDAQIMVAPPVAIGSAFAAAGGIILGILGGTLGFVLLVIGLILYFIGRSKAKNA